MISKAYRSTRVNDVDWERIACGREGVDITLGLDVASTTFGRFVDGLMAGSNARGA